MPKISVVMSVYRDVRFLNEAVLSILGQTFDDFELLVVDDGSENPAPVASLSTRDRRIRTAVNSQNLGLARSLNNAIAGARAPIIARMDADDIAHPERLRALWSALDQDPRLSVVGSNFVTISEAGEPQETISMPAEHRDIVWAGLFFNPFCHSSIAFRKDVFDALDGYDESFDAAQDYDLWMRILRIGRGRNLQEPLLHFRLNPLGISATKQEQQRVFARKVHTAAWSLLGVDLPHEIDSLAILASGFRLMPVEYHLKMLGKYLWLYHKALPTLATAFPSLRQNDTVILGHRILGEAREYLKLIDGKTEGSAAVAKHCHSLEVALNSLPDADASVL